MKRLKYILVIAIAAFLLGVVSYSYGQTYCQCWKESTPPWYDCYYDETYDWYLGSEEANTMNLCLVGRIVDYCAQYEDDEIWQWFFVYEDYNSCHYYGYWLAEIKTIKKSAVMVLSIPCSS